MLNDNSLWCEDCDRSYTEECCIHGPHLVVLDNPTQEHGLPSNLTVAPTETQDPGVFSLSEISNRTRFGPLVAKKSRQSCSSALIYYKLFVEHQAPLCYNTSDTRRCNWMIFVRPALRFEEQNLVAFQYQANIYFAVTKLIEAGTELKVWYCREYAANMGSKLLQSTQGVEEVEGRQLRPRLACPRCQLRVVTPFELDEHVCSMTRVRTPRSSHISTPPSRRGRPRGEEVIRTRAMQRQQQAEVDPATPGPSSGARAQRAHRCTLCEKSFSSPGKLYQHMYSHTGERPFACSECSKAFSSKFKLMRHLLIHSADRKHQCPFCERSFHRKDHLKNHSKVHNPDKKVYRCEKESCRKEYNSYLSYRKHVAVHAAEDGGLDCKICGKNFTNREEILYHLKVHAGSRTVKNPSEKKFQCDHCERRFFTRKDVKRHLVVHTGKRDFLCQYCPQRFGRKDHLVRHIKKSHGGRAKLKKDSPQHSEEPTPGPSGNQEPSSSQRQTPVSQDTGLSTSSEPQRRGTRRSVLPPPPPLVPAPVYYPPSPMYPSDPDLGIKMEEDEEPPSDFNQLFHLAGSSSQAVLDPMSLIEELSVDNENQLMQLIEPPPPDPTPLPCFHQVFQQPPPPPQ